MKEQSQIGFFLKMIAAFVAVGCLMKLFIFIDHLKPAEFQGKGGTFRWIMHESQNDPLIGFVFFGAMFIGLTFKAGRAWKKGIIFDRFFGRISLQSSAYHSRQMEPRRFYWDFILLAAGTILTGYLSLHFLLKQLGHD